MAASSKVYSLVSQLSHASRISRCASAQSLLLNQRTNIRVSAERNISLSKIHCLKEIRESVNGDVLTIEGVYVESDRAEHVVKVDDPPQACCLCRLNLDLEHTDVLILNQFVLSNGCIISRSVTGLCEKQQRLITALINQAKKAGLLTKLSPDGRKKDPKLRDRWNQFNRYFVPEPSGSKTKMYK